MSNRKDEMLEAAMQVVAEGGLESFSMKKVTDRIGVSEALLYKYFGSKSNLLYSCYEVVHRKVGEAMSAMTPSFPVDASSLPFMVHELWMTYFDILIRNGDHTLFYYNYRDSKYLSDALGHDREVKTGYFRGFVETFYKFDNILHIYDRTDPDLFWTYIIDTTGVFAKRIIKGEIKDTPENRESAFKFVFSGISSVVG